MKVELKAIYIMSLDEYVRSSTKNTKEVRHIKLFETESQAKSFIRNNGISKYDCEIVNVILEVEK